MDGRRERDEAGLEARLRRWWAAAPRGRLAATAAGVVVLGLVVWLVVTGDDRDGGRPDDQDAAPTTVPDTAPDRPEPSTTTTTEPPEPLFEPEPSDIVWREDFEAGALDRWGVQSSSPDRISVVGDVAGTGRALSGRYSVKVVGGPDDQGIAGSRNAWRSELRLGPSQTGSAEGATEWWRWTMLVGDDFHGPRRPREWVVLTQFHAGSDGLSPVVAVEVDSEDRLNLRVRGGDPDEPDVRLLTLARHLERDQPYTIDLRIDWSAHEEGRTLAWLDGEFAGEVEGPNLYRGNEQDVYLKMGIYRSDSDVGDGTVYFDDIHRAVEGGVRTVRARG